MEKIDVKSTSSHSAICSDIILRETDRVRLVFRPEIVDNPSNPEARVNGKFLYQRKGNSESWQDFETLPLSSVKKGEGYQLALHAGEVLILRHTLYDLARLHREQGIPQGHAQFLRVENYLAELLELTQPDLDRFFSANSTDAIRILGRVLRWLADTPGVAPQLALDETELPTLNAIISRANLRAISELWADNSGNADEEFWQKQLSKHSSVLGLLFAYPIVVIKGKAYVGGKQVDNKHGNLVDFLARIPTSGNAVLIEIKNPTTPLLGLEYRDDVFAPSNDLTGAISQVIHYRESLLSEPSLRYSAGLSPSDPKCLILLGSAERELIDEARKRSFERFRERLLGVTILTFDELFARVSQLRSLLE